VETCRPGHLAGVLRRAARLPVGVVPATARATGAPDSVTLRDRRGPLTCTDAPGT
jgi:hypothetical protein